ncbi:hypothetical protein Q73_03375 [Bacillus coahuilensis m2-6]|uniref:UDP-N-acetylmuramoyl-L-alanyl-D-glutamate--2, 6-diaminopimelate ligase n=1 Tax=Bacillus coahuilensis TaxID=408580 RepID=UPI00075061E9|nr:UDP-N-acetylmuramoyl-L-alanyl-D-glutamate--2,6-diaminopimelate ligase [Bacillus coahuilensis]KUP09329.1 hypothetical protein Q73_03375 [Bacillus coahuilensis m2-6]
MKLSHLLKDLTQYTLTGNPTIEISQIEMDSRRVKNQCMYICVPGIEGFLADRHDYIDQAIENGAHAILVEKEVDVPSHITVVRVEDVRFAFSKIAAVFHNEAYKQLKIIGLTGTNGKTTTTFLVEKLLNDAGLKTGLMGNLGTKINGIMYPTELNTQEPHTLHRNFAKMVEEDMEYCVMEVSSQGIDMGRMKGVPFYRGILTNLTHDHLDYHGTVDHYMHSKSQLFTHLEEFEGEKPLAILNKDDDSYAYFKNASRGETISYGIDQDSIVQASELHFNKNGIHFKVTNKRSLEEQEIHLPLVGKFNVYNALAAITVAYTVGVTLEEAKRSLENLSQIPGRMESFTTANGVTVIVDYAHTPDALENVLQSLKSSLDGKLITVVGCGGNRDENKRPIMGKIAAECSDYVYFTSDNPRFEQPEQILEGMVAGAKEVKGDPNYTTIIDRKEAIRKAILNAHKGDVILIAGKGHETYQEINGVKYDFSDKEVAISVSNTIQ